MKKKIKYRIKTKEEFIRDGKWNAFMNIPFGWNPQGQMNKYLGVHLDSSFNSLCDKKKMFHSEDGWSFTQNDYVLLDSNKTPMYRFKTKEEFKNENNWNPKENKPYGWETGALHLLGSPVPFNYNDKCKVNTPIVLNSNLFDKSDYVEIDNLDVSDTQLKLRDDYLPQPMTAFNIVVVTFSVILITTLVLKMCKVI